MSTRFQSYTCPWTMRPCLRPEVCFAESLTAGSPAGSTASPCVEARPGWSGKMAIGHSKPLDQPPLNV